MNDPKRFFTFILILFAASAALAWQADPSAYFEQNCSPCHTIGGGASAGPDLKGVTHRAPNRHWLVEFIRNPETKIKAKDPYATRIVAESGGMVMTGSPDVTEEFGEALLEYIDRQSGAAVQPTAAIPGSAARGREFFLGQRRLSKGAAACVACHQASGLPLIGGRLGPDLSAAHLRLGGDHGLNSWLRNPPSKVMSTIFRPAPLTAEEASDLTAFLRASAENSTETARSPVRRVQTIGLLGSLVAFLIAGVIWRGRLAAHDVRQQLLRNRGRQ